MASIRFAQSVRDQIDEARALDAQAHVDPMTADDGGAYLTPQMLTDVTHDMRVPCWAIRHLSGPSPTI